MPKTEPVPTAAPEVFPDTIGGCLAELAKVRALKERAETKVTPLAEREVALRNHLLNTFKKDDLNGEKGSGLAIAIVTTKQPKVADWDAFFAFAKRKGNDDLVNRAVNSAAWRARVEEGKAVPGVEIFQNISLRVSSSK